MTQIHSMLSEKEILLEIQEYKNWQQSYVAGKSQEERPALSENRDAPKYTFYGIVGSFIHSIILLGIELSRLFRLQKLAAFFAELRIYSDRLSFEPMSCGYNNAYTKLGLALLSQGDIDGAIRCLETSWHVHPCPHNMSYGLKRELVSKLKNYPVASKVVDQYIKIGKEFISWPEKWTEQIIKS